MNPPESPKSEAYDQVRSRTPEEREAKRRAVDAEKQRAIQARRAAADAQPIAGQGITVHDHMITSKATGSRAGGGEAHTFMIQENGYITEWEFSNGRFIRRLT